MEQFPLGKKQQRAKGLKEKHNRWEKLRHNFTEEAHPWYPKLRAAPQGTEGVTHMGHPNISDLRLRQGPDTSSFESQRDSHLRPKGHSKEKSLLKSSYLQTHPHQGPAEKEPTEMHPDFM